MSDTDDQLAAIAKARGPFDMNIPVTWAIGALATALLTFGGTFTQIKDMNAQLAKLESKLDRQDTNFQNTLAHFSDTNSKLAILDMRMTQSEKELSDLRQFYRKEVFPK